MNIKSLTMSFGALLFSFGMAQAATKPAPKPPEAPVFSGDGGTAVPTITCDKSPGAGLCYALGDALLDYTNVSNGQDATDAVWSGQQSSASSTLSQFEMDVLPTDKLSEEIGKMAFALAEDICNTKRTGTDSYGYQAIVAEIKLMPRLLELQQQSGITNPKSCKEKL